MKKTTLLLVIGLSLTGCAKTVLLKNAAGDVQKCEADGLLTGVIGRNMSINQCVKQYEKAGYTKVDDLVRESSK